VNPVVRLRDNSVVVGPAIGEGGAAGDGAGENRRVIELNQVVFVDPQGNV